MEARVAGGSASGCAKLVRAGGGSVRLTLCSPCGTSSFKEVAVAGVAAAVGGAEACSVVAWCR